MSTLESITRLRKVCTDNGIYNLAALVTFVSIDGTSSPAKIGKRLKMSQSATYQWFVIFEVFGLISREDAPHGHKKSAAYTEEGLALLEQIRAILAGSSLSGPV
jgi:DNA-binding MarR family transcriptional regulator